MARAMRSSSTVSKKKKATKPVKKSVKAKSVKKISAKKAPKSATPTKIAAPKRIKAGKVQKKGPLGYTPDQYQKYKDECKRLSDLSNQALKDILKKNLTSMTGNKDQLIFKVADGIVLGRIPRCPKCFGGRPKFDYKKGTYHCSGYRDDEDFHNCHTTFQLGEIKRQEWQP